MILCANFLLLNCAGDNFTITSNTQQGDYVVILHGRARSSKSMKEIERKVADAGHVTINIDYPSRKKNISQIADWFVDSSMKCNFFIRF